MRLKGNLCCVSPAVMMNQSVPELWDELSTPEEQSNYHSSFPSFFPSNVFFFFFFGEGGGDTGVGNQLSFTSLFSGSEP